MKIKFGTKIFKFFVWLIVIVFVFVFILGKICWSNQSYRIWSLLGSSYGETITDLLENQPENLKFSFKQCNNSGGFHGTEVKKVKWRNDNKLYVVVTTDSNCGDDFWSGDYKIEDETNLILIYNIFRFGGESACICQVELRYTISGLEKLDYAITVEFGERIVP